MNRARIYFLALLFSLVNTGAWAGYQQVALKDLINDPGKHDQRIVSFQAEAIGEPLYTESGNWFNLTLDSYYLGIFVEDKNLLKKIKYWGSYKEKGDIVKVKGSFYKNCLEHSQSCLHLDDLEIAKRGRKLTHPVSQEKKVFALTSFIICLTMALIYFIKIFNTKKRQKNIS